MYKALFFDIDDTILDYSKCRESTLKYACRKMGMPYSEKLLAYYIEIDEELWTSQKTGKYTIEEVIEIRAKKITNMLGCSDKWDEFNILLKEGLSVAVDIVNGAEDVLKYAIEKKYKIFAASNGILKMQINRLKLAGLIQYFDDIYVSDDIGYEKPNEMFFRECMRRSGFQAEQVLMIGDSYLADIVGAYKSGIDSCWLCSDKEIEREEQVNTFKIEQLEQLKMYL